VSGISHVHRSALAASNGENSRANSGMSVKIAGLVFSPAPQERVQRMWSVSYHPTEETSRFILSTGRRQRRRLLRPSHWGPTRLNQHEIVTRNSRSRVLTADQYRTTCQTLPVPVLLADGAP
jgi:hypothetical protein